MWTHVIWDFNGTLLDDLQASVESINVLLAARNLPIFSSLEAYRQNFGFPVEKYYRAIGLDVDGEGFDALAHEWVGEYLARSRTAGLRKGVLPVLEQLHQAGVCQLVLSASEHALLSRQLGDLGIEAYFDAVLGIGDIYAGGKTALARAWRAAHPDARPIFVGDTLHDAEVAAAIGADCVLVTGGHHGRERLESAGVPVIDSFAQLPLLLEGKIVAGNRAE
ncbi:MAG: HAD family hydrolase [Clostridia bacterium]|nr:HAD family hydrolase [Clostridia bacterium]